MNSQRILAGYRCALCLLILIASMQTLVAEHQMPHVVPLASAEIVGALLLIWRRSQWLGLTLLLLVFAAAEVTAAMQAAWPTRFLQYAASALLIALMDRALRSSQSLQRAPKETAAGAQ